MNDLQEIIGVFQLAAEHDGLTEITPAESKLIVKTLESFKDQCNTQQEELLQALWGMVTSFHAVEYMEDHMLKSSARARAAIAKATGDKA